VKLRTDRIWPDRLAQTSFRSSVVPNFDSPLDAGELVGVGAAERIEARTNPAVVRIGEALVMFSGRQGA
jgi:hypothetical protein